MEKYLKTGEGHFRYCMSGEGPALVLLHGYLEALEIWLKISERLSQWYKVVLIDLPGHGKSSVLDGEVSLERMAGIVYEICQKEKLKKIFLVGHSMGGYVTLAYLEKYPKTLTGFSLMHSHPFADSSETIVKREREIALVQEGKKEIICSINIPNAFAPGNLSLLQNQVEFTRKLALNTSEKGMISALNAMKGRSDRSTLLIHTQLPFLWVLGKHDQYIPYEGILKKVSMPQYGKIVSLEKSGHQGFMEEEDIVVKAFRDFIPT